MTRTTKSVVGIFLIGISNSSALGFVLGWRGRAELVRAGAAQGEVTAEFDLPAGHAARAVLAAAGFSGEEIAALRSAGIITGDAG